MKIEFMKQLLILCTVIFILGTACTPGEETSNDYYYFITRLGNDTLAIERISKLENSLRADVVLRSPRISLTSYNITWDETNKLTSMTSVSYKDSFGQFPEGGKVEQKVEILGDSLISESQVRSGMIRSALLNDDAFLPFFDMVHWPYDIAFNRAHQSESDSIHQYLITGRRASDFIIHNTAENEYTIRHPSRGVMYVQTNSQGDMVWLDAKETTRKLIVERVAELEFDRLTTKYLEIDKKGSPFGTLSPAVENTTSFGGADFRVNYGSPQKRGRTIFGGIVTYGELWRTGANSASHFSSSKDIYVSGNKVPAGEYTLFSIPEENGGTLIINKQTGQNGRAYDEGRDLMRVPMSRSENSEETEGFTIKVMETEEGGSLELLWDRTIYYVNFNFEQTAKKGFKKSVNFIHT